MPSTSTSTLKTLALKLYPIAPVFDTIPLNIAVMSYCGNVYCCIVGDRETLQDADRIVEMMREELDELHSLAAKAAATS